MTFTHPLPWWALVPLVVVLAWLTYRVYDLTSGSLSRSRRGVLTSLRALTLALVVVSLLGPVMLLPPKAASDAVVAVLIDTSRSMRLADTGGATRLERAVALVRDRILPQFSGDYRVEVLGFGAGLAPVDLQALTADAPTSDLSGAVRNTVERYRGQHLAGLVVVSDGGDTGGRDAASAVGGETPPVFSIGVGSPVIARDREVVSLSSSEAPLDNSLIDLSVAAVSHGFGTEPVEVRLLANGKPADLRRVMPSADGSPVSAVFTVSPPRTSPVVYTVEIPPAAGELSGENNRRDLLVSPPGRKRLVLLMEGAPGFEHSFLKRALALDQGLDVDAVVRKGRNDAGHDTFYIQAAQARTGPLSTGFPVSRQALFAYDAVILANIEGDFFSRDQLALAADFVSARGGGLLLLGHQTFASHAFAGTPLDDVLPVDLEDRGGDVLRTSLDAPGDGDPGVRVEPTREGDRHPVTRLGVTAEESRRRWAALPELSAIEPLGKPRPGAQVLGIVQEPDGVVRPAVAVQRYGSGRSMVFAGEASWRWRMLMPASDRTYETFWRQAVRWLSTAAQDPVTLLASDEPQAGRATALDALIRDAGFAAVRDASVIVHVTHPGGVVRDLTASLADPETGRYSVSTRLDQPGVYHVAVEARRGSVGLGRADRWFLVGAADREFADPRQNTEVLRRLAASTGGQFLSDDRVGDLGSLVLSAQPALGPPERRELWHNPWVLSSLVGLLAAEWSLRRRWGLR